MSTEPSIFTKIINREISANIVYEDEHTIAFLTIEPVHHGHTLVVPKVPFRNMIDGDEVALGRMVVVAKKVGVALIEAGLADGFNLAMNNEPAANQEVFHAHMHVIPRYHANNSAVYTHEVYDAEKSKTVATTLAAIIIKIT